MARRAFAHKGYSDGYIRRGRFRTYYRQFGVAASGVTPLVVLHGGPGSGFDNVAGLEALWRSYGRPVLFYDQCGCGRSTVEGEVTWNMGLFVDELRAVCADLGMDRPHLLGSSWGGMVALEAALHAPDAFRSLTLMGVPYDSRRWAMVCSDLIGRLPNSVASALRIRSRPGGAGRAERSPSILTAHMMRLAWLLLGGRLGIALCAVLHNRSWADDLTIAASRLVFARRHQLRMAWPPLSVFVALQRRSGRAAYSTLWGEDDFRPTGVLREWSVETALPRIKLPVLVLSGEHDQATPSEMSRLAGLLPSGRHLSFAGMSHALVLEDADACAREISIFLREVDRTPDGSMLRRADVERAK